ncbi:MAG: hypothetical protein ACI9TI_001137 [Natronomonas sp.]|jgi:hypothetical protein
MEDVLALYHEPYDEARPVICFDESSKALRGNSVETKPSAPLTGSSPLTMLGSSYVSSIQLSSKRVYRFRVEATLSTRVSLSK